MTLHLATVVGLKGRAVIPDFPFNTPNARSTSFLAASCALTNFFSLGSVGYQNAFTNVDQVG